jgi:hypothetical protein
MDELPGHLPEHVESRNAHSRGAMPVVAAGNEWSG